MIFFHNIYKTLCPRQELTFGIKAQLWQELQGASLTTKDALKVSTGLTSVVPIPPPPITFRNRQPGNQGGLIATGSQGGGNYQSDTVNGNRRACQYQARYISAFVQSFWVHRGSRKGIISHLWKHDVISLVKSRFFSLSLAFSLLSLALFLFFFFKLVPVLGDMPKIQG